MPPPRFPSTLVPDHQVQREYRRAIALVLVVVFLVVPLFYVVYQGVDTLRVLTQIELERDQWQRPSEILQELNLAEGDIVADVGSGSGYFALKLAPMVGKDGRVFAIDIRRLPLVFLWIRAFLRPGHNVRVIHGESDNPRLPQGVVDAVLIANTYHELTQPKMILDAVLRSLKPGGRLVVVDRVERTNGDVPRETSADRHGLPLRVAEAEIHQAGFEIVNRHDRFIDRSIDDETWWVITARKP